MKGLNFDVLTIFLLRNKEIHVFIHIERRPNYTLAKPVVSPNCIFDELQYNK